MEFKEPDDRAHSNLRRFPGTGLWQRKTGDAWELVIDDMDLESKYLEMMEAGECPNVVGIGI